MTTQTSSRQASEAEASVAADPRAADDKTVAITGAALRRCLGQFATGVTVVTYWEGDDPRGATMNAFTSVSIEPPLVLISVAKTAKACERLEGRPFAVNVLSSTQHDVALRFAGKPVDVELDWERRGLAPHLSQAMAWFECKAWRAYDGGDHRLFLGEVQRLEIAENQSPLVFFGGRFRSVGAFADNPIEHLEAPELGWLGGSFFDARSRY